MNKEKFLNKKTYNSFIALLIATIPLFAFMFVVSIYSKGGVLSADHGGRLGISNILLYIIGVALFCVVFLISYFGLNKSEIGYRLLSGKYAVLFLLVIAVIWMVLSFFLEDRINTIRSKYDYYRMPLPFILYSIIFLIIFFIVRLFVKKQWEFRVLSIIIITLFIAINGFCLFESNFFADRGGGIYHIQAYSSSIINVVNGYAYSDEINSIYGHYGLFYYIPVIILNYFFNNGVALGISYALVGLLTFAFSYYVFNKMICNKLVLILAVISFSALSYESIGNYYQLFPHRLLFQPLIIMGCISVLHNRENKLLRILFWIFSVCGIIWNFETGIICSLVYVLCNYYIESERRGKYFDIHVVLYFVYFLGTIVASYIFVNAYNLIVGGNIIGFLTFIYPIMSKEYDVVGLLQVKLDIPFSNYFSALLLFLFVICGSFEGIINKELSNKRIILILSSIIGLGVMPYYINRAVMGNLKIIYFPLILAFSVILDTFYNYCVCDFGTIIKSYRCLIVNISLFILVLLSYASIIQLIENFEITNNGTHNYVEIRELCDGNLNDIPENTAFIGNNSDLICIYLDRENAIAVSDWPDITQKSIEYIWKQIQQEKIAYIFVDSSNLKLVLDRFENAVVIELYEDAIIGEYALIQIY